MRRSIATVVVGMVCGCHYGPYTFTCTDDASCGPGGTCERSVNLCSFADPGCPSGRAFGDLGGPRSGQCVDQLPLDAGLDAPPDALVCLGSSPFSFCFTTPPTGTIDVSTSTTFDTVNGTVSGTQLSCAAPRSGDENNRYCVLAASTITIRSLLRTTGTKPLVLVAVDSMDVTAAGMIDVSSHRDPAPPVDSIGAGADPTGCVAGSSPGTGGSTGGGGAGGSFLGAGGDGGRGSKGGSPGDHGPVLDLDTILHGGCPGQDGADGVSTGKGVGGHGGGAVFLIAGNTITVAGTIDAGGEGGGGATGTNDGGGGGGAGGLIGFDAMTIMVTGTLVANGGGGGGGSSSADGHDGGDASSTTPAPGGTGGATFGGDGGAGSAGAAHGPGATGQQGVVSSLGGGGGGGGGGGAGIIKGPTSLGGNVSPAATP